MRQIKEESFASARTALIAKHSSVCEQLEKTKSGEMLL